MWPWLEAFFGRSLCFFFFFLFCPFSTSCWDVDEVAAASAATLHVGVREGKATLLLTAQTEAVVLLMVLSCGFCFFFF